MTQRRPAIAHTKQPGVLVTDVVTVAWQKGHAMGPAGNLPSMRGTMTCGGGGGDGGGGGVEHAWRRARARSSLRRRGEGRLSSALTICCGWT